MALITLDGIAAAVDSLKLKENTLKAKLVRAIRARLDDSQSLSKITSIDPLELIAEIWELKKPDAVKTKRKNFSSLKSSINKTLKESIENGSNPEGLIISRDNVFAVSEEQKNRILEQLSFVADADNTSGSLLDSLTAISKLFSQDISPSSKEEALKMLGELDSFRENIARLANLGPGDIAADRDTADQPVDGDGGAGGEGAGSEGTGDQPVEELEVDDDTVIEFVDEEIFEEEFEEEAGSESEEPGDGPLSGQGHAETQLARSGSEGAEAGEEDWDSFPITGERWDLPSHHTGEEKGDKPDGTFDRSAFDGENLGQGAETLSGGNGEEKAGPEAHGDFGDAGLGGDLSTQETADEDLIEVEEIDEQEILEEESLEDFDIEEIDQEEDFAIEGDQEILDDVEVEEVELEEIEEEDGLEEIDGVEDLVDEEVLEGPGVDIGEDEIEAEELIEVAEVDEQEVVSEEEVIDENDVEIAQGLEGLELGGAEAEEPTEELADDEEFEEIVVDEEDAVVQGLEQDGSDLDIHLSTAADKTDEPPASLEEDDWEYYEVVEDDLELADEIPEQVTGGIFDKDDQPTVNGSVPSQYIDPEEALVNLPDILEESTDEYIQQILERFMPKFIKIPGGTYLLGGGRERRTARPAQKQQLPVFYIGQLPITNDLYDFFVRETGYETQAEQQGYGFVTSGRLAGGLQHETGRHTLAISKGVITRQVQGANWRHPEGPGSSLENRGQHPVVQVSRLDAVAFASWAGKRLPTEDEWEAAARGPEGFLFPWGNQFHPLANLESHQAGCTTPILFFGRQSMSPFGLLDMVGNVFEWTATYYKEKERGQELSILKGGSWASAEISCAERLVEPASTWSNTIGFRCAVDAF